MKKVIIFVVLAVLFVGGAFFISERYLDRLEQETLAQNEAFAEFMLNSYARDIVTEDEELPDEVPIPVFSTGDKVTYTQYAIGALLFCAVICVLFSRVAYANYRKQHDDV